VLARALGAEVDSAVAAKVDGEVCDLSFRLVRDAQVEPVPVDSPEGRQILRHSAAHIMAQAVKELYPEAKLGIGPATEEGFYYDFDLPEPLSEAELEKIEARMQEIVAANLPFIREELPRVEAAARFLQAGEMYKEELIREIDADRVSIYSQGSFSDLCRGPHIPSTGRLKAFKLLSVAGAYWRGNEKNKMLQRIYGTAFPTQAELEEYLARLEEAKRRDHRRLGRELDLFSISDEAGAGLVIYHPKGALLRSILEDFEKRLHLSRGYQLVLGPHLLRLELWQRSGHYDNYRENMYFTEIEGQKYAIKPMNCLAHMLVYKSRLRSYRELPLRYFELGTVYRHEKSGVLHGLLRVRGFTQDDAHILCTPEQLNGEIVGVLELVMEVMGIFGFDYQVEVSTRPEKSIGSDEDWEKATAALYEALETKGLNYAVCEGEGAFYGPKIDVKLKDALGRLWQCATIQCDFTLPERFDLYYIGPDGRQHRPVMLHRVVLGALERFIGVLIEHYGGAFPLWLAPEQVRVLGITDAQDGYVQEVAGKLAACGIRVEQDLRREKIGYKIREAQLQKVPYMLILGRQEAEAGCVSVRHRRLGDLGRMGLDGFLARIAEEIKAELPGSWPQLVGQFGEASFCPG